MAFPFSLAPTLSLGSGASSPWDQTGASFAASGAGDWNVNLGGSGAANQSATGGVNWLLLAVCAGAAWFLFKK